MTPDETRALIARYGAGTRDFFAAGHPPDLMSPLFNMPARLVVGSHCYFEHAPDLLRRAAAAVPADELGRRARALGHRPNAVGVNSLMLGYLNGREQRRLLAGTAAGRAAARGALRRHRRPGGLLARLHGGLPRRRPAHDLRARLPHARPLRGRRPRRGGGDGPGRRGRRPHRRAPHDGGGAAVHVHPERRGPGRLVRPRAVPARRRHRPAGEGAGGAARPLHRPRRRGAAPPGHGRAADARARRRGPARPVRQPLHRALRDRGRDRGRRGADGRGRRRAAAGGRRGRAPHRRRRHGPGARLRARRPVVNRRPHRLRRRPLRLADPHDHPGRRPRPDRRGAGALPRDRRPRRARPARRRRAAAGAGAHRLGRARGVLHRPARSRERHDPRARQRAHPALRREPEGRDARRAARAAHVRALRPAAALPAGLVRALRQPGPVPARAHGADAARGDRPPDEGAGHAPLPPAAVHRHVPLPRPPAADAGAGPRRGRALRGGAARRRRHGARLLGAGQPRLPQRRAAAARPVGRHAADPRPTSIWA